MTLHIQRTHGLTRVRPDVLQQTVLLGQSVDRVVSLTSGSDVAGQGVGGVRTSNGSALSIDVGDVDLDGSVVLSLDDSVRSRTLSWHVQFDLTVSKWFWFDDGKTLTSRISRRFLGSLKWFALEFTDSIAHYEALKHVISYLGG